MILLQKAELFDWPKNSIGKKILPKMGGFSRRTRLGPPAPIFDHFPSFLDSNWAI